MNEIRNYKDLKVWQQGRLLVKHIYDISRSFPDDERYGLCNQIRRAVVSIPSNVAEGHSRNSTKDYVRFISIAIGSLAEVETQLLLACDLSYCTESELQSLFKQIHELQKMLHVLRRKLTPNP